MSDTDVDVFLVGACYDVMTSELSELLDVRDDEILRAWAEYDEHWS